MQTLSIEIQNGIIRQILDISDIEILSQIQKFLIVKQKEKYKLSDVQLKLLEKSEKEANEGELTDNEEVFNELEECIMFKKNMSVH
jgi:predicted transcriptional regulator